MIKTPSSVICILLFSCLTLASFNTSAGILDDFESDATKNRYEQKSKTDNKKQRQERRSSRQSSSSRSNTDDDGCGGIVGCIIGGLFKAIFNGLLSGSNSDNDRSYSSNRDDKMDNYSSYEKKQPVIIHNHYYIADSKEDLESKANANEPVIKKSLVKLDHKPEQKPSYTIIDKPFNDISNEDFSLEEFEDDESEEFAFNDESEPDVLADLKTDYSITHKPKTKERIHASFSNQDLGKNLSASHLNILMNNGKTLDFEFNLTKFYEENPNDTLELKRLSIRHRMPLAKNLELGIGIGLNNLAGNSSTNGISFNTPLYFHASKNVDLVISPTIINFNGTELLDLNAYTNIKFKKVGLLLGIRSLKSPAENLTGPYAGLSVQF